MRFDLEAARLNKGLSQRDLAKACGVSLGTVQRLEGDRGAHPKNAHKVAQYFDVQVTDLMPLEREAA